MFAQASFVLVFRGRGRTNPLRKTFFSEYAPGSNTKLIKIDHCKTTSAQMLGTNLHRFQFRMQREFCRDLTASSALVNDELQCLARTADNFLSRIGTQAKHAPALAVSPQVRPSRSSMSDTSMEGAGHHGQLHPVMTSVSSVTAPLRASALPSKFTPVVIVMDVSARMFPLNTEFVPKVAELPTCQKTLQASAPLTRTTWLPLPVVRVEAIWKMNTASELRHN